MWSRRRTLGVLASASPLAIGPPGARADIIDALNAPIGTPFNDLKNELLNDPATYKALPGEATVKRTAEWTAPNPVSDLGRTRIGINSILPLPNALPLTGRDTLYPSAFAGDWVVGATLVQTVLPFGPAFLPSAALVDGPWGQKVGDSAACVVRYLPTTSNGEAFAVADRAYNLLALGGALPSQPGVVAGSVVWDPQKDPNKLSFRSEDASSAVATITSRKTEDLTRTFRPESRVFACAERSRTVTTTASGTEEDDREFVAEFRDITRDSIRATARVAVYLLPSRGGTLWSKVKGKAVALYDYELLMKRA